MDTNTIWIILVISKATCMQKMCYRKRAMSIKVKQLSTKWSNMSHRQIKTPTKIDTNTKTTILMSLMSWLLTFCCFNLAKNILSFLWIKKLLLGFRQCCMCQERISIIRTREHWRTKSLVQRAKKERTKRSKTGQGRMSPRHV